jgi:hypothetical protein
MYHGKLPLLTPVHLLLTKLLLVVRNYACGNIEVLLCGGKVAFDRFSLPKPSEERMVYSRASRLEEDMEEMVVEERKKGVESESMVDFAVLKVGSCD